MAPLFSTECPKCHANNKSGARFCGSCGERLPGSEIKCSNCGAVVAADKAFCGNCGKPLSESAAPMLKGNRWARRVDDFATKIEVDDVEGFFKKGLIVEAGTKAIFFVNGAYSGILEPGRYDMGGVLQKIKNLFSHKTTTAILVDAGDAEMQFSVSDLATSDPIRLTAECRMVIQMESPTQFFENLMKGRQNYSLSELKGFLEGELRNCLTEFVGGKSVQELSSNLSFKQQMEQGVAQHLAKTFERKGLGFVQVRLFNFRHPRIDAITNKKEEYWLHAEDLKAQLAGQDSTMGLERRVLDQETAETLMKLEVFEDRAKVYDRMRKAVASDKMNEVSTQSDLEKFLQGMDKDKLLRAEEMQDLLQDFAEKKEDHDLARRHMIQKMKVEEDIDLARAGLVGKLSLNRAITDAERDEQMAELENALQMQRKQVEQKQQVEWSQLKQELDSQKAVAEMEIDLSKKKTDVQLDLIQKSADVKIGIASKQTEEEIRLEEMRDQADLRTAAASLEILKGQKAIKKDEADHELDLALRSRAGHSEISMKEEALRHQQELEKIQAMSTLSAEALIAAAPADRAALLTELKRTEALKGFSEDQILAMAADKNPEVAKAFQEKYKNASSADVTKAYEKMLVIKDQSTADLKEMSREHARMTQEMFNRAMDTQRDTAVAATRAGQQPMTVITPGPAGVIHTGPEPTSPASNTSSISRKVTCPECGLETEQGPKFCDNCGHKFV